MDNWSMANCVQSLAEYHICYTIIIVSLTYNEYHSSQDTFSVRFPSFSQHRYFPRYISPFREVLLYGIAHNVQQCVLNALTVHAFSSFRWLAELTGTPTGWPAATQRRPLTPRPPPTRPPRTSPSTRHPRVRTREEMMTSSQKSVFAGTGCLSPDDFVIFRATITR